MSERNYKEGDAPIYEEAVDEYLALVNGPTRVIGNGSISPPVDEDSTDLIAVVRRGVESGTIKGEVVRAVPVSGRYHRYEVGLENPGDYIVIGPVSDGGSET